MNRRSFMKALGLSAVVATTLSSAELVEYGIKVNCNNRSMSEVYEAVKRFTL